MPKGYDRIIETIVTKEHLSERNRSISWKLKYYAIIDYIVGTHLNMKSDDFVNINQKMMKKVLSCTNVSQLLLNLSKSDLISSDKKMSIAEFRIENGKKIYTKEGKSFGFKIPDYNNKIIGQVTLEIADKSISRIKRNKEKVINQDKELKLYQEALNCITIDTSKLPEIIEEIIRNRKGRQKTEKEYKEYISKYNSLNNYYNITTTIPIGAKIVPDNLASDTVISETFVESEDKIIARVMRSVGIINSGEMYATRPVKNSRVYCELTNLNRELRKAVLIDGKNIIGLDIRNSQPLIASYLFKKFYTDDNLPIPDDVMQYQKDCEQGIFYDDFMKVMNLPKEFRSEFKKDFFQRVFFDRVYHKTNLLLDLFIKKYPSVWNVIKEEKGGYTLSKDYKQFARRLQEVEALIMFDTVNIALLKLGIKCYNNYDSIYVNNLKHFETAKKLIVEAFNAVGINPTINPEYYSDEMICITEVSYDQILKEVKLFKPL